MSEKYDIQARFSRIYLFEHIAFKRRPQADFKSAQCVKDSEVYGCRQIRFIDQKVCLDFVALQPSVKPWRHTRRYLCRCGPASCSQIFKVALTLSHSVDKVGFRSSKMVDDSVMPAFALAVSYIDKASRACALNWATEGLV